MRFALGTGKDGVEERLERRGISRRQFLKFCSAVAVAMGMGPGFAGEVAKALAGGRRASVVYLHGAECTGCSESVLRAYAPFIDELILDTISLDYHETLMAAAGEAAEKTLHDTVNSGQPFVCVVEGAIPMAENGMWGTIGGQTMFDMCKAILPKAAAVISYGTCSSYGGIQAAKPNPSQARGINDALKGFGVNAINIPGCPPNPLNLVGTLVYWLQNGKAPEMDTYNRPLMFFGKSVHEQCPRLPHFEKGEFAPSFASKEARDGWCLYELGCRGPNTFNNCPKLKFNGIEITMDEGKEVHVGTNWPVEAGHPCLGCSEPDFWDDLSPFYKS